MAASSSSSNQSRSPSTRRRKKKLIQNEGAQFSDKNPNQTTTQWKSSSQQQLYSTKLFHTLLHSQVDLRSGPAAPPPAPIRVRQAADRVLASMAKGRSRWSRAILTGGSSRLKLKFMRRNSAAKQQRRVMSVTGNSRLQTNSKDGVVRLKSKDLPAVERKAKVLGRLVPGCRKQPLNVVLEEASDYIAALEMQVRAMSALADLLSVSGSTTTHHHHHPSQSGSGQDLPNS